MTIANRLTFLRILLIPVFMVLVEAELGLWPAVVFLLASLTDFLDGYLARSRGEVTTLGKFLDPLADKLLTMTAFVYLAVTAAVPAWAVIIILARETAVTGLRVISAERGIVVAASGWGKLKTVAQMVSLTMLLAAPVFGVLYIPGLLIFYVALAATVFSGWDYFRGGRELLR